MSEPIPVLLAALEQVAKNRPPGYLEDVMSVSKVLGGVVHVPAEDYARLAAKYNQDIGLAIGTGPGSQLKRMLGNLGIRPSPGCLCNKRAALMDVNGSEWCERNLDEIVGWLREEAQRAHLPFVDQAGKILIRRAIKLARGASASLLNKSPVQRW